VIDRLAQARPREMTGAEVAAVVAAVYAMWNEGGDHKLDPPPSQSAWRFSGRWWAPPGPTARRRPWVKPLG